MEPQGLAPNESCKHSAVQKCSRIECQDSDIPAVVRTVQVKYKGYYRIVGECVNCGTFQKRFWFTANLSGTKFLLELPHVQKVRLEDALSRFTSLVEALAP